MVKEEEKAVVIGRVEPATHRVGTEETTLQRDRTDKDARFLMWRPAR